jgi:hypothetical protein
MTRGVVYISTRGTAFGFCSKAMFGFAPLRRALLRLA